jgi:hypothetical protein
MDGIIPPGERTSFDLEPGKLNRVQTNSPARFEILTTGGTLIAGIVVPNAPLEITAAPGDISSINIYVLDRDGLHEVVDNEDGKKE